MAINYGERIPDDVDLDENRALQRALERWQAKFLEWRPPDRGGEPLGLGL